VEQQEEAGVQMPGAKRAHLRWKALSLLDGRATWRWYDGVLIYVCLANMCIHFNMANNLSRSLKKYLPMFMFPLVGPTAKSYMPRSDDASTVAPMDRSRDERITGFIEL
jgi:hypothetical protein